MPEWMLQVGTMLVMGGAIYGGIRADLKSALSSAKAAHRRIDDHLRDHTTGDFCIRFREGHDE